MQRNTIRDGALQHGQDHINRYVAALQQTDQSANKSVAIGNQCVSFYPTAITPELEAQMKIRANAVISTAWAGNVLTLRVVDDGKVLDSVEFDRTKASAECRDAAERYGWQQRLVDKTAMSKDTQGHAATPGTKLAALRKLVDHYLSGTTEWRLAGSGGGGGSADTVLLINCLVELQPARTVSEITAIVMKWSGEQRSAMLLDGRVAPVAERLRKARVAGVGTEDLFAELDI